MNKVSNIFIAFQLTLLLLACTNKNEKNIRSFELHRNQIRITQFVEIESTKPFLAKDSIVTLKQHYKTALRQKMTELSQVKHDRLAIKQEAKKTLEATSNKQMQKIINKRIEIIESEINHINKLIETYSKHPEQTFFKNIEQQIIYYNSEPNAILGYTQKVVFMGKEGLLPEQEFEKTYFLNAEEKIVATSQ